jgi:hypothetical protein
MARARNIKPGLFKNEILGVADPLYTLMFEGLWVLADREGRLEDRPLRIKAEVFPYREVDPEAMLNWLVANGFIRRYVVAGKRYILICEFVKHQNPHKNESESVIPPPEGIDAPSENIGKTSEEIGSTRADSLSSDSLIPDSLTSLPNGKGADAPDEDAIWDTGLQFLVSRGAKERGARGFLGKMRQAVGDLVAAELLAKAQQQNVSEPIPWLRSCAQRHMNAGRTTSGVAL